jgi:alkylhydroperoxidase/carboxymuconolactone decarboxylase family protein YurZ
MKDLLREAPAVGEAFFGMTRAVREYSTLGPKVNELIILGIFAAHGGARGIHTHVERACAAGASKEDILAAILLALPVVGISKTNEAIAAAIAALQTIDSKEPVGNAAAAG